MMTSHKIARVHLFERVDTGPALASYADSSRHAWEGMRDEPKEQRRRQALLYLVDSFAFNCTTTRALRLGMLIVLFVNSIITE